MDFAEKPEKNLRENLTATEVERRIAEWGKQLNEAECRLLEPAVNRILELINGKKH